MDFLSTTITQINKQNDTQKKLSIETIEKILHNYATKKLTEDDKK
jgi:hypothetical protein